MTMKELKGEAKLLGVKGYSKMKKADLEKHIKEAKKSSKTNKKKGKNSSVYTVYTISGCGYCKKAKDLLKEMDLSFTVIKVTDSNEKKIYSEIDEKTGKYRYFPIIFEGDKFIGGFSELEEKLVCKDKASDSFCTIM